MISGIKMRLGVAQSLGASATRGSRGQSEALPPMRLLGTLAFTAGQENPSFLKGEVATIRVFRRKHSSLRFCIVLYFSHLHDYHRSEQIRFQSASDLTGMRALCLTSS